MNLIRTLALALLSSLMLTACDAKSPANAAKPVAELPEAAIRKGLAERAPELSKIDEVRATPISGLFEVRLGLDLFYTDATGRYLLPEAAIIDLQTRSNLTQARVNELSQVPFAKLPLQDAVVWKRGNGSRRLAVFADPNCGYCKRLERTLQELDDITVYAFVIPILGEDSVAKSRAIICAKDSSGVWLDWMLRNKVPQAPTGTCDDSAMQRNSKFARQNRINGTPAIFFEDGSRAPGALDREALEQRLKRAENPAGKSPEKAG
jgi:thiol:disulfide interchange protein DsbC